MEIVSLLSETLGALGVPLTCHQPPYDTLTLFDGGLRRMLSDSFECNTIVRQFKKIQPCELYFIADNFDVHYVVFRLSETTEDFCVIGPYIDYIPIRQSLAERFQVPEAMLNELREYYNGIPLVSDIAAIRGIVCAFANRLFGGESSYTVLNSGLDINVLREDGYLPPAEQNVSLSIIGQRYAEEDAMLDAIARGDENAAIQHCIALGHHQFISSAMNQLRSMKDSCTVMNSITRKAVQAAQVHPAHIHAVSEEFTLRIGEAATTDELYKLAAEMVHEYCVLARKYSLKDNSPLIRNVIDHIDFHFAQDLSLKSLAERFNCSSGYLSAQFKKENGVTLTDYLNGKRLEHAKRLLTKTQLTISEVAQKVGFDDINYFSRLFKRSYDMTPREYRTAAHEAFSP